MIEQHNFPLDYFGVAANGLVRQLLTNSTDRRSRKVALNALVRMAKNTKSIPKNATIQFVGLSVDCAGQIFLGFTTGVQEAPLDEYGKSV